MAIGKASPPITHTTTMTVTGTDSALVHFRVHYKQFMELPVGQAVHSDVVSIGGQLWRIDLYPQGIRGFHDHVSIFLRTMSSSSAVKAIIEPFFLSKDGGPPHKITKYATVHEYNLSRNYAHHFWGDDDLAYPELCPRNELERYVVDGHITFVCAIAVLNELSPIPVPPSNIRPQLGHMLDDSNRETSDVSFLVDGETFHAHRAVLAARSPVFKAQLYGSMIEATATTSAPITLHEMASATFRAMLRFIYTDDWPQDGDSPSEMLQDLLAAADRYALDRLKLMCAHKLSDSVSVDTVATILACAEMHGCPELKKICIDFCAVKRIFNKVASTEGYVLLELRFPLITAEIREKIDTAREDTGEEGSSSSESSSSSSEDEGSSSDDDDDDDDDDDYSMEAAED